jgi:hypothetical protein
MIFDAIGCNFVGRVALPFMELIPYPLPMHRDLFVCTANGIFANFHPILIGKFILCLCV